MRRLRIPTRISQTSKSLFREKCVQEELCDARSLLAKVYLNIEFDKEDNCRLDTHMDEHRKHRINDYEEEILEPIRKRHKLIIDEMEIIKRCSGSPGDRLKLNYKNLKGELEKFENADVNCIEFLDKYNKFKNLPNM